MQTKTVLEFTRDDALVLEDWLTRAEQAGYPGADAAERRVLERLAGQLEEQIGELFLPDYKMHLTAARQRLASPPEGDEQV